jgi:hypothetical protein
MSNRHVLGLNLSELPRGSAIDGCFVTHYSGAALVIAAYRPTTIAMRPFLLDPFTV